MKQIGEMSLKTIPKLRVVGLLLMVCGFFMLLCSLAERLAGGNPFEGLNVLSSWEYIGITFGVLAVVIVLHEGLHGLGFKWFGGKVKFGATANTRVGLVFYATSPNTLFAKRQMMMIALLPQVMTVGLLASALLLNVSPIAIWMMVVMAGANLAGSALDIYGCCWLARFPRSSLVEDAITETRVFAKE